MPSRTTGTIAATGADYAVSISTDKPDTSLFIGLSGTFAGMSIKVEGQDVDGNWYPVAVVNAGTRIISPGGTAITLTDDVEVAYYADLGAFTAIRVYATARTSGTLNVRLVSDNWGGGDVIVSQYTTATANALGVPAVLTGASATALVVGPNGTTNPSFKVVTNTASAATGLAVTAAAAAGGLAVAVLSSGDNEALTIDAKGSGTITLNGTGTGNVVLGRAATGVSLAVTGALTSSGPTGGGIGYAMGAGGAVTQETDRSTGVEINKLTGAITTDDTSLAAGAQATFTVTNSTVAVGDTVILSCRSGQTAATSVAFVSAVAAGSFDITLANLSGDTADTGAMIINFAVIKAVGA